MLPSESESEVAQSCPTLCDPMGCSLPGSSIHRIFQARILEWVAISFSRGSSQPRDWTWISCIVGRCFTIWAIRRVPGGAKWISKVYKQVVSWTERHIGYFFLLYLVEVDVAINSLPDLVIVALGSHTCWMRRSQQDHLRSMILEHSHYSLRIGNLENTEEKGWLEEGLFPSSQQEFGHIHMNNKKSQVGLYSFKKIKVNSNIIVHLGMFLQRTLSIQICISN